VRSSTARRPDGSRTDPTDGLLTTLTSSATPSAGALRTPSADESARGAPRLRRRPPSLSGRSGRAVVAGAAAVAAVVLGGCGSPEYRFVSNNERDVVVRVPWEWSRIDPGEVEKIGQTAEQRQEAEATPDQPGHWLAYFDSAAKPAPKHIVGGDLPSPVVWLRSENLPESARQSLTADQLRDFLFPVSEAGRAQLQVQAQATGEKLPAFALLSDDPVKTRTAQGVHVVFSIDGEVFDQVTVTDTKRTRFHMLLVHCSKQCYERSRSQISEITDSFTIKNP
jgi:hypothetical protein